MNNFSKFCLSAPDGWKMDEMKIGREPKEKRKTEREKVLHLIQYLGTFHSNNGGNVFNTKFLNILFGQF